MLLGVQMHQRGMHFLSLVFFSFFLQNLKHTLSDFFYFFAFSVETCILNIKNMSNSENGSDSEVEVQTRRESGGGGSGEQRNPIQCPSTTNTNTMEYYAKHH